MTLHKRDGVYSSLLCALALLVPGIVGAEAQPRDKYGNPLPIYEIRAKGIPTTGRLDFNANALPKGTKGKFASFDGDTFIVHFPPHVAEPVTAAKVFSETIVPLLKGMGYAERINEIVLLSDSADKGDRLPSANLSALAAETCREVGGEKYQRFHPVCKAMQEKKTNETAERVFQLAYGMTFVQFVQDIERQRIQYVFTQRPGGVPIEHAAIVATRSEGEAITSVHGAVFGRYSITNKVVLSAKGALTLGQQHLLKLIGTENSIAGEYLEGHRIDLVLLPYGDARRDGGEQVIALRNTYRTLLFARRSLTGAEPFNTFSWMAWIDAETGALLELTPQFDEASAVGLTWRRDPNTPTQVRSFNVDAATGGQFTLQLADVFNRIDRLGNGTFADDEVTIPSNSGGSSANFANFNQTPINDAAHAVCGVGGNNTFRQVNVYANLYSQRQVIVNAGTIPTFPEAAVTVYVDMADDGYGNFSWYDKFGSGHSLLNYVIGTAYGNAGCPDVPDGTLPGTEDATSIMHEFAHLSTKRLQERRPANWCGMSTCSMPTGRTLFHDFADSWAQAYASTPCQAGWSRKNAGVANASVNCATNDEGSGLPRLSSVGEPFDPANVQDHFPERRASWTGDYADGQIVSTALWLTRQGMRSKCLPSGTPQFFVRLNRALYNFGFLANTCGGTCDRDIYRFAQDLLRQMAQQWATAGQPGGPPGFAHNGAHSTNKLLSGFARVGLFLIPNECIDGDGMSGNPTFCPTASGGENGGDAIVDVDDNDPADDPMIDGILHPEMDYVKRGAAPPTFRVWTGPRYKFNVAGEASSYTPSEATPSPCNSLYQVELAGDDAFTTNLVTSTVGGSWRTVSNTTVPECYARWTPTVADWTALSGTAGDTKVFYRVRTRDAGGANEKISTKPGSGSFGVPPAYVVVNNAGQP